MKSKAINSFYYSLWLFLLELSPRGPFAPLVFNHTNCVIMAKISVRAKRRAFGGKDILENKTICFISFLFRGLSVIIFLHKS